MPNVDPCNPTNSPPAESPSDLPVTLSQDDYRRLSHVRYQLRRFLRFSEDICHAEGLTSLQYQLLLHVKAMRGKDWASVGELAEKLQAKHHGVVALLDRCEKLGLIQRRINQEDRRQVEIHLLPEGEKVLERLAVLHQPELRMLESSFSLPAAESGA
ncbi:MarR family winged helix-turn-helix transcriptional regulator [Zoogloea sp.]|uniref:MarR family winged helix-turn-helix transcriptional regulator n=1 Tax=Zoogloea sp. TaxID=49181 RepID=UPI0035B3483A